MWNNSLSTTPGVSMLPQQSVQLSLQPMTVLTSAGQQLTMSTFSGMPMVPVQFTPGLFPAQFPTPLQMAPQAQVVTMTTAVGKLSLHLNKYKETRLEREVT